MKMLGTLVLLFAAGCLGDSSAVQNDDDTATAPPDVATVDTTAADMADTSPPTVTYKTSIGD